MIWGPKTWKSYRTIRYSLDQNGLWEEMTIFPIKIYFLTTKLYFLVLSFFLKFHYLLSTGIPSPWRAKFASAPKILFARIKLCDLKGPSQPFFHRFKFKKNIYNLDQIIGSKNEAHRQIRTLETTFLILKNDFRSQILWTVLYVKMIRFFTFKLNSFYTNL